MSVAPNQKQTQHTASFNHVPSLDVILTSFPHVTHFTRKGTEAQRGDMMHCSSEIPIGTLMYHILGTQLEGADTRTHSRFGEMTVTLLEWGVQIM